MVQNTVKRYVEKNPEVHQKAVKRYTQENPEVHRESAMCYAEKNPDINKKAMKLYYTRKRLSYTGENDVINNLTEKLGKQKRLEAEKIVKWVL